MDWSKETQQMIDVWQTMAKQNVEAQAEWTRIWADHAQASINLPLTDWIEQPGELQVELLQSWTQTMQEVVLPALVDISRCWQAWSGASQKALEGSLTPAPGANKKRSSDRDSKAA